MASLDYSKLTKEQKIAAFLVMIGVDAAAEIMKHFDDHQIELICREIAGWRIVDESIQRELLLEFSHLVGQGVSAALGGASYAEQTLQRAKGEQMASNVMGRLTAGGSSNVAAEIRQMEGLQILNLVKSEQPQTLAFILSYLDVAQAAEIITMLSPEIREDVTERLGGMEATSRNLMDKITKKLNKHFDKTQILQSLHRSGGVQSVANILNALERETRKTLLNRIEERNPVLGAEIRKKVFSFEDLIRLEPIDLQRVIREIDMGALAIALKSAKPALIAAIMASVSKRAAEALKEDIEMLGPVKLKDVEAAQDKIITVVRRLEEAEEITLDGGGDDRIIA